MTPKHETRLIPLYDATADIACTIDDSDVPARLALLEQMRDSLVGVERTEDGLLLRFVWSDATERCVREFVEDEKRCCQFWGFGVAVSDDEITLQWDAPPSAQHVIVPFEAFLRGEARALSLKGWL